jgi:hypothetical protein
MGLTGGPPLKQNLAATTREVSDFLASLKGKSPAQAMGVVAQSPLFKGLLISGGIQIVLMLALTLPFALGKKDPPPQPQPVAVTPTPAPATRPATRKAPQPGATPAASVPENVMRTDVPRNGETPMFRDDLLKDNK